MRVITERDFDWSIAASERKAFTELWPDGAAPTLENAQKAQRAGLSLRCAAQHLLRDKRLARFQGAVGEALGAYRRAVRPLIEETKRLWLAGDRPGWTEADARLQEVKRQLWPDYQEAVAGALVGGLEK